MIEGNRAKIGTAIPFCQEMLLARSKFGPGSVTSTCAYSLDVSGQRRDQRRKGLAVDEQWQAA